MIDGALTSFQSPRVSTPLSFQTFGAQQSNTSRLQIPSPLPDGVERPSFDSVRSSSPSTDPPSTPHRQVPSPVLQPPSMTASDVQGVDRLSKLNRRFRVQNATDVYRTTPDSPKPTPLSPPPRTTKQDGANEPTLRRIAKRRGRPALGVATYAPAASNVVVEGLPLSPVVASPRSTMFHVPSHTSTPAPDNVHFSQVGSSGHPISPDVTLDISDPPAIDSGALMSPLGTRHIVSAVTPAAPSAPEKWVQYKPRKRMAAPRKKTVISRPAHEAVQPIVFSGLDTTPQSTLRKWSFTGSKQESPQNSSTLMRRFSRFSLSPSSFTGGPTSSKKAATDEGHGYVSDDTGTQRLSIGRRLSHFVTGSRRQSFAGAPTSPESPDRRKVIMLQSHLSRPHPPSLQTSSIEVNNYLRPGQPSTVTVRSGDGWYSTVPSSLTTQESALSNVEPALGLDSPGGSPEWRPSKNLSTSSVATPTLPQQVQRANGKNMTSLSMPPSPIGPTGSGSFPRPSSFQQSHRFSGNGSITHDPLGGVPEQDGSVRLLDAATAAAIRRSVDFDDRVKKSEDMLRAAIYGPTVSASPRSSTVSINHSSMDRGRGGKHYQPSRSQSLDNRHGHHRIRTGSFGIVQPTSRDTRGGVFLPGSVEQRSGSTTRSIIRINTTSSYATPPTHEFATGTRSPVPTMTHLPKVDDNHYTTTPMPTLYNQIPLRHRIGNKISRIFSRKPS